MTKMSKKWTDKEDMLPTQLNIWVENKESFENYYQQQYQFDMHKDFVEKREAKKHNINSHSQRMRNKIKYNHLPENIIAINKRKIVKIDFWMNIWTEINGIRPAIIYKANSLKYGEDVTVLPITSYKDGEVKAVDHLDVELPRSEENWLTNNSLIKIRQLTSVSKKRIKIHKKNDRVQIMWEIKDETIRRKINSHILKMFWLDALWW